MDQNINKVNRKLFFNLFDPQKLLSLSPIQLGKLGLGAGMMIGTVTTDAKLKSLQGQLKNMQLEKLRSVQKMMLKKKAMERDMIILDEKLMRFEDGLKKKMMDLELMINHKIAD